MLRRRTFLYAALALAVPLPAFALSGGAPSGSDSLTVSASLDGCGIASSNVVCKIDASWNEVAGAERYTASVASPDGAVSDYGDVTGTGTSIWVPYVGNGTYTVTVTAWGTPPGADNPVVVAKQRATTDGASGHSKPATTQDFNNGADETPPTTDPGTGTTTVPSDTNHDPPPACDQAATPSAAVSGSAIPPVVDENAPPPTDGCPESPPAPPTTTTTTTTTPTPPATTSP